MRTSWRVVPSVSAAVTTMALGPGLRVSGTVTASEVGGVRSACCATSAPLSLTLTRATPLLDVTTAATTLDSSVRRARSSG